VNKGNAELAANNWLCDFFGFYCGVNPSQDGFYLYRQSIDQSLVYCVQADHFRVNAYILTAL
jgi:hypothetical protein